MLMDGDLLRITWQHMPVASHTSHVFPPPSHTNLRAEQPRFTTRRRRVDVGNNVCIDLSQDTEAGIGRSIR